MTESLERLQKRLLGDGPAEKQVLLLKLLHEFETAPEFGNQYIADANSGPQRWIARIGALLARAGIEHKVSFNTARHTLVQFWSVAREPLRKKLLAAAEEIKLELELDGHEELGKVYEAKQQYDFLRDLKDIILGARKQIFIVDPYFDGQAFETYIAPLGNIVPSKILCSNYSSDVAGHLAAFKGQYGQGPELKKNKNLHDRLVIIDGIDCWVVGGSIKEAGKKPTYLVPLQPSISQKKLAFTKQSGTNLHPSDLRRTKNG